MTRTCRNFTLIEMLTVIAIIAILAGLIIPAVGRARVSAKTAACISNQGQTMKIIQQSINDNDGHFLSPSATKETTDKPLWSVQLYNKNYIQDVRSMRCPGIVNYTIGSPDLANSTEVKNAMNEVYGAAYLESTDGFDFRGTKYLTAGSVPVAPSALAIGGCAIDGNKKATARMGFTGTADGAPYKIHANFSNFFFYDGHAESLEQTEAHKRYFPASSSVEAKKIDRAYVVEK